MSLVFKPEQHEYQSIDGEDISWISVTSLIGHFKQPFDAQAVSRRVTKSKNSKWFGIPPDKIREVWQAEGKRATDTGTWYHDKQEAIICGQDYILHNGKDIPVIKPNVDEMGIKTAPIQKLVEAIYPEHLMYLKSSGICGQSDKVEVISNQVNITDYKTSKEIKKEAFKNWSGATEKMLAPLAHLDNCNFIHYALQLSLYMYMIIKHNPLLRPGKMILQHIIFEQELEDEYGYPILRLDENREPIIKEIIDYEVPYMKQEVILIINWLKDNKQSLKKK